MTTPPPDHGAIDDWEAHGFSKLTAQNYIVRGVSLTAAVAGRGLGLKLSQLLRLREAGVDIEELSGKSVPGPTVRPVEERLLLAAAGAAEELQRRWDAAGLTHEECYAALLDGTAPEAVEQRVESQRRARAAKEKARREANAVDTAWRELFASESAAVRDAWRTSGLAPHVAAAWKKQGFLPAHALKRASDDVPSGPPPTLPHLVVDDRPPFVYRRDEAAVEPDYARIGERAKTPEARAARLRPFGFDVSVTTEKSRQDERRVRFLDASALLTLQSSRAVRVRQQHDGVIAEALNDDGSIEQIAEAADVEAIVSAQAFVDAATGWTALDMTVDHRIVVGSLIRSAGSEPTIDGVNFTVRRSIAGTMVPVPTEPPSSTATETTAVGSRSLQTYSFCGVTVDRSGVPLGWDLSGLVEDDLPLARVAVWHPPFDEVRAPNFELDLYASLETKGLGGTKPEWRSVTTELLQAALSGEALAEFVLLSDVALPSEVLLEALGSPGETAESYDDLAEFLGIWQVPVASPVVTIGAEIYLFNQDIARWLRYVREDETLDLMVEDLCWVSMFESASMVSGTSLMSVCLVSDGSLVIRYAFDSDEVSYAALPDGISDLDALRLFAEDPELGWAGATEAVNDAMRRRLSVLDAIASDYGDFSDSMELRVVLSDRALSALENAGTELP